MNVSPYELLCASKPKVPQTLVKPYDLYSSMQQNDPVFVHASIPSDPLPAPAGHDLAATVPSVRKTHYISDIHAKHSSAGRRTAFVNQPL